MPAGNALSGWQAGNTYRDKKMKKLSPRKRRHRIIRKKILGTKEKPRLCVTRSARNLYAQLIDDMEGRTIFSLSTAAADFRKKMAYGGNRKAAGALGKEMAEQAVSKGVSRVVFDRAGYLFHGRIKEFADAARKNGLVF